MATYETYLTNPYTNETTLIKSNDVFLFEEKKKKKQLAWEKDKRNEDAQKNTGKAQKNIEEYKHILKHTLDSDDTLDWSNFKNKAPFKNYIGTPKPIKGPFYKDVPRKSILEFITVLKEKRIKAELDAKKLFIKAIDDWEDLEKEMRKAYDKEKSDYMQLQETSNKKVDDDKANYEKGKKSSVIDYIRNVLTLSEYPETLNLFSDIHYEPNSKLLLIKMKLPNDKEIPKVKEYKYIKTKDITNKIEMAIKEFDKFYNELIYNILFRTIHEVFESDYKNTIETVVFNGWVEGIDPKTGNKFNNCIVSLQTNREEFESINLANISPLECFRHLKGITAGSLVRLAPIKPIMQLDTEDKRIISTPSVIEGIDESVNLAIMDWQEFEVLVRDLIQKVFSGEGCKVEVTRASRDAGVDAIAFDQDPIKGGKFVIQAKRYNNIVPVSAVRDLYGTMMNEGAVKGILVTTSYYGRDSLHFAKDKPLKLINGEELIYLFNKHGYKVRIELTKKQKSHSSINY